mgnify:CR=1 FL=1
MCKESLWKEERVGGAEISSTNSKLGEVYTKYSQSEIDCELSALKFRVWRGFNSFLSIRRDVVKERAEDLLDFCVFHLFSKFFIVVIACIISDDIDVFSLGVGLVKSDGGIGIDAQTFMSNDIRHIMCIKYLLMLTRSLPLTVGLLQTFALPHPSIGRACVMSRMSTVSVMMVDITLFHAVEAFLYHLDEGFLLICIFLTRGLCSSLIIGKAYLGSKDPLFRLAYMLFRRLPLSIHPINMSLQLFTKQAICPLSRRPQ